MSDQATTTTVEESSTPAQEPPKVFEGFGTFKGVFLPSLLTILGVIMYLRLGWVVGNVGLTGSIIIITLASAITFLTGLSIAATATNMKVKGGGAYFMVSRSFGIEAGAAIGLPLFLAQAFGISFYISGFAESVHSLLPDVPIQIIGLTSLVLLTALAYFSASLALKAQMFIFLIILGSLVSFFLGQPITQETPLETALPTASFWVIFAVFFPAVTGIEAGISMSGDLKNPSRSLPLGTISAVICGYLVYIAMAIALVYFATSDALISNSLIIKDIAVFAPLVFAGIWGATLSSALGALLGAPRTLQALSQDRVVPKFLGKGFGPANDPRIATILTFVLAGCGIYFGSLDLIAPILSMFFLTSYGALNLISGLEGMIGNPSWRPTFRTPWALSLLGAFGCFAVMLMIDAGSSFIALFCCVGVYFFMRRRNVNARWSNMKRGLLLFFARSSIYKLATLEDDARSWRPNMLVLSGSPKSRWYLIALADAITHGKGFLTVSAIINKSNEEGTKIQSLEASIKEYLNKEKVPALVKVKYSDDFLASVKGLITDYGLGPLKPNTLVFGEAEDKENFVSFSEIIKTVHHSQKNLLIVREGLKKDQDPTSIKNPTPKSIDVWWGRQQNNATLMLAMAYLLQTSQEWMGSKLTLKSVVYSEEERQGVLSNLKEFLQDSRIEAEVEIYVAKDQEKPFSTIQRYSKDSDLVFLGMKAPQTDETSEEYSNYYKELLDNTTGLPFTVITLAGQEITFKEIFQ